MIASPAIVDGRCLASLTAATSGARANVSLKNGNFFIGYTDIIYPGGFEPKIERVYNSKTPFKGMFGWGWGNEYEVYLTVSADGSVVVHEYGGGAENRFSPVAFNATELDKAVETIAAAAQKVGRGRQRRPARQSTRRSSRPTPASATTSGRSSAPRARSSRAQLARRHQAALQPLQLPVHHQGPGRLRPQLRQRQDREVRRGRAGCSGSPTRTTTSSSSATARTASSPRSSTTSTARCSSPSTATGCSRRSTARTARKPTYKYNGMRELTRARTSTATSTPTSTATPACDGGHRHNMVEIGYSDKTTMDIEYFGRDKQESVKAVKDRDGTADRVRLRDGCRATRATTAVARRRQGLRRQGDLLEQVRVLHQAQGGRRGVDLQARHRRSTAIAPRRLTTSAAGSRC